MSHRRAAATVAIAITGAFVFSEVMSLTSTGATAALEFVTHRYHDSLTKYAVMPIMSDFGSAIDLDIPMPVRRPPEFDRPKPPQDPVEAKCQHFGFIAWHPSISSGVLCVRPKTGELIAPDFLKE